MEFKRMTLELKERLDRLAQYYLENEKPKDKRDKDFFMFVREQTTPTFQLLQEWEMEALKFVKNRDVRVHPQQVSSTKENMDLLLMHSYYIDVNRKRYMNLNKSVHYVFDILLEDLN
ncbi:DUF1798 family protein [Aquibacillus rhizosphaerae]|uniref:DUF1798 family protein n=1 Tax=Aquibacillus rhizosphaerae TaxID=3051431 RepID=A0ABT7L4P6_9BACI|nr:DUF1798 family protein [Aquibacillus sp. LR5S19]MDL4840842.1 DUF1798 family protein [Aquibacillus sp. LR5S19]